MIASYQQTVSKNKLFFSKAQWVVFFSVSFENSFTLKKLALKEPFTDVMLHSMDYSDIQKAL